MLDVVVMLVATCIVSMLITPSRACSALTAQFDFVEPTVPLSLQFRAYALGTFVGAKIVSGTIR